MCFVPQQRALFHHLNFQKCSENGVLGTFWIILTLKCASRHNGLHFFNFQKCSEPVSVLHFWLRKCLAPQRRALFRYLNFQKWSEHAVFCTCWLTNVLRATTACKLFISHLARWLRTRRFSDATFRSSRATNHLEKHYVSRLSYLFAHRIFFLRRLSLSWSSFFFSSLLWLFPSLLFICPYGRKFDF